MILPSVAVQFNRISFIFLLYFFYISFIFLLYFFYISIIYIKMGGVLALLSGYTDNYTIAVRPSRPFCERPGEVKTKNGNKTECLKGVPFDVINSYEKGMFCELADEEFIFSDIADTKQTTECLLRRPLFPYTTGDKLSECPPKYTLDKNEGLCKRDGYKRSFKCHPETVEFYDKCYDAKDNYNIDTYKTINNVPTYTPNYIMLTLPNEQNIQTKYRILNNQKTFGCDSNETEINGSCYSACPTGSVGDGTKCRIYKK
jgi:hypothetical protein